MKKKRCATQRSLFRLPRLWTFCAALFPYPLSSAMCCCSARGWNSIPSSLSCALPLEATRNDAYPTFSLALAALPEAHWSALTPAGPLRRWRLIEVGAGDTLINSQLRIDERVLHYLTGVSYLDARLQGLIESLPPPADAAALAPRAGVAAGRLLVAPARNSGGARHTSLRRRARRQSVRSPRSPARREASNCMSFGPPTFPRLPPNETH